MKRRGAKKILETPLRRLLVLWAWPATRRGGNEGTVASHPCSLAPRAIPWDGGVQGLEGGVCGRAKSEESGRLLPSTLHYGWRLLPSTSCGMWASSTSILKGGVQAHHVGCGRLCQAWKKISSASLPSLVGPRGSLLAVFLGQGRRAKRRPACRPAWRLRQVAMASQEAGLRKPVNGLARDVGNCLGKSLGNTAFFPSAG